MPKYHEIHISDVRAFKQCRRKWNWASPLRQNLEPNVPYVPFFTGRAIHHCIEFYYRDGIPLDVSLKQYLQNEQQEMERAGRLWPQEHALIAEQIALIGGILEHYHQWVTGDTVSKWSDNNLEFVQLETDFSVPLHNPQGAVSNKVYLAGRFDGIVRRKDDGSLWLLENKTTRSISEMVASLDNDEQCGTYVVAARHLLNRPISGVLYNLLRKKVPTKPAVLQSGLLSQNKSMDTTAFAYIAAAREVHGSSFATNAELNRFILQQYRDMIQSLLDKGNTFFARIPITRTQAELDQLERDLWAVAMEMTRSTTPLYPSPSWMNCRFCHFRAPCLALNANADYEFLLESEYRERQPWQHFENVKEEFESE